MTLLACHRWGARGVAAVLYLETTGGGWPCLLLSLSSFFLFSEGTISGSSVISGMNTLCKENGQALWVSSAFSPPV